MYSLKNKSISILAVDDNPLDRLIVQTLLQQHFNIEVVSNGYDALDIIEEIKFDIILMDINLNDESLDGISTMKLIKQNEKHSHLKIFAITAYSEDINFHLEQGFDAMYIKTIIKE